MHLPRFSTTFFKNRPLLYANTQKQQHPVTKPRSGSRSRSETTHPPPPHPYNRVSNQSVACTDFIRWEPSVDNLLQKLKYRKDLEIRSQKFHKTEDYYGLKSYKELNSSGMMRLERLEEALRFFFEKSGMRLGEDQKKLIHAMKVGFLRKMFGKDLLPNIEYLRRRYNVTTFNDTLMFLYPRRSGKTVACGIFAAAIIVSQPEGNTNMYNLTGSHARDFIREVKRHLDIYNQHPLFKWKEVEADCRNLISIRIESLNVVNVLRSFACALYGEGTINNFYYILYIYEKGVTFHFSLYKYRPGGASSSSSSSITNTRFLEWNRMGGMCVCVCV